MNKTLFSLLLAAALLPAAAWSQDRIYRCGNEYTNNPAAAKNKNCNLIDGGNVTFVQGNRARNGSASASAVLFRFGVCQRPNFVWRARSNRAPIVWTGACFARYLPVCPGAPRR